MCVLWESPHHCLNQLRDVIALTGRYSDNRMISKTESVSNVGFFIEDVFFLRWRGLSILYIPFTERLNLVYLIKHKQRLLFTPGRFENVFVKMFIC